MLMECLVAVINGSVVRNKLLDWHTMCMANLVIIKDHEIARVAKDRMGYSAFAYVSDQEVERLVKRAMNEYRYEVLDSCCAVGSYRLEFGYGKR
jgi:hypothetical protein